MRLRGPCPGHEVAIIHAAFNGAIMRADCIHGRPVLGTTVINVSMRSGTHSVVIGEVTAYVLAAQDKNQRLTMHPDLPVILPRRLFHSDYVTMGDTQCTVGSKTYNMLRARITYTARRQAADNLLDFIDETRLLPVCEWAIEKSDIIAGEPFDFRYPLDSTLVGWHPTADQGHMGSHPDDTGVTLPPKPDLLLQPATLVAPSAGGGSVGEGTGSDGGAYPARTSAGGSSSSRGAGGGAGSNSTGGGASKNGKNKAASTSTPAKARPSAGKLSRLPPA